MFIKTGILLTWERERASTLTEHLHASGEHGVEMTLAQACLSAHHQLLQRAVKQQPEVQAMLQALAL